jgi:mannobiose 2-epimerase
MVVGLVNAFQITKNKYFLNLAMKSWQAIEDYFIDREYGEWFYAINAKGYPDRTQYKVSEWKGPYHNGRACVELLIRLKHYLK